MNYLFYKVHNSDICNIKHIIDAYENMMALSTIDATAGKIQITVATDVLADCELILQDLATRYFMQRLTDEDSTKSQGRY